jgi:hypothetical protein
MEEGREDPGQWSRGISLTESGWQCRVLSQGAGRVYR